MPNARSNTEERGISSERKKRSTVDRGLPQEERARR